VRACTAPAGKNNAIRRVWQVEVEAARPQAEVTLTWELLRAESPGPRWRLVDLDDGGRRVAMQTRSAYRYRTGPAGGTRHFLVVAEEQPAEALAIVGLSAMPTRDGGQQFAFTLTAEADVTAEVQSLSGRPVRPLEALLTASRGLHAVAWDGCDEQGRPVPNGTYLVRVVAATEEGEIVQAVRTVQVRR
jgi:hypothetical protein